MNLQLAPMMDLRMLFLCVVIVTPALVRGHEFYVSPDGDDASTGSFAAPFRTLQKCVDAAQSQSKDETANGMANGASIVLSSMATVAAQRLLHAGLWGAFCNWRSRVCSTKGEPSVAHKGASTLNAALGMDLERVQMEMMERPPAPTIAHVWHINSNTVVPMQG